MQTRANKNQENKNGSTTAQAKNQQKQNTAAFQFTDNLPKAIQMQKLQKMVNSYTSNNAFQFVDNRREVSQMKRLQELANSSPPNQKFAQLQKMANSHTTQQERPIPKKPNNTGLPDNLKSGIENLTGYSMDDVQVHYNSDKPAQLRAYAYAQGTNIHLGSGQEKHLPHEAWHVVQQKQGRVKPTMQMKDKVNVNNDTGLEHEADIMGQKVLQLFKNSESKYQSHSATTIPGISLSNPVIQNKVAQLSPLSKDVLNVVGENHPETEARLDFEKAYCTKFSGLNKYWSENEFKVRAYSVLTDFWDDKRASADPFKDRFEQALLFAEHTNFWHYNTDQAPQSFKNKVHSNPKDLAVSFVNGVFRYTKDMKIMIEDLEEDIDGHELTALSKQTHIALKDDVNRLHTQVSTCITMLNKQTDEIDTIVAALDLMWANLKTLMTAYGPVRTYNEVRISRSDAMHQSAEARSSEKGVWKIGESHQKDIAGKDATYNLVSRNTFNSDYLDWRSETILGPRDEIFGQRGWDGIGNNDL